jgi:hypothetical protein
MSNLTPEQVDALLRADFKRTSPGLPPKKPRSEGRRIFWAGAIMLCGVLYALFKLSTSTASVVVINATGEDAMSVTVIAGSQRIELGPVGNGAIETAEVLPGEDIALEYQFAKRQTWKAPFTMRPFQSVRLTIIPGGAVQVSYNSPTSPQEK